MLRNFFIDVIDVFLNYNVQISSSYEMTINKRFRSNTTGWFFKTSWFDLKQKSQIIVKRNNCRRQECLEGTFEDTKQYLEAVNQRWTYVYKYHGQKKKAKKTNNDLHHTTQKTKD